MQQLKKEKVDSESRLETVKKLCEHTNKAQYLCRPPLVFGDIPSKGLVTDAYNLFMRPCTSILFAV